MIGMNMRWVCGRLRRTRKLWVVVCAAAILLLLGKNFRSDRTTGDDDRDFYIDGDNRDPIKFVDLRKTFDGTGHSSAMTKTSAVDLRQALDSRKPNQTRVKKLHLPLDNKKNSDKKKNDTVSNSSDLKKAFENNSGLKSVDLKKAFDSKTNDSKLNSVDRLNASNSNRTIKKTKRLSDEELPKAFARKLTGQEKAIVFEILQALDTVSAKLQLPYFLCGGTLLGSFRHHDLIPWDDDVDIYMNITERDSIYSGLSGLSPTYEVFAAGHRLKLYSRWSHASSIYPWKYPYVDINFFYENATHIIDSDPVFDVMAYRKETIFPLHRRPLGGLFLFAPFDTYSYLTHTYTNITLCSTSHYDHRTEKLYGDGAVKITMCLRLRALFPFVYRTRDPDSSGIRETLMISDTKLHTMVVSEPQYVVGDPFSSVPNRASLDVDLVTETRKTVRD